MAWPNRETAGRIQTRMTSYIRTLYSQMGPGVAPADRAGQINPYDVARHMWAQHRETTAATFNDFTSAAYRALRAVEAGRAMHDAPDFALRLSAIPRNYGIRTPANRIEYRVVVMGINPDSTHPRTEGLVIVRSRDPLTLQELERQARRVVSRTDPSNQYRTRVPLVGADVALTFHVASVSRYEAN